MMSMIRELRRISETLPPKDAKFLETVANELDAQARKIIELDKRKGQS